MLVVSLPNRDAGIGRFISPDTVVPNPANPQSLNRYSYVLNNPLKYTDPSGHSWRADDGEGAVDEPPPPPPPPEEPPTGKRDEPKLPLEVKKSDDGILPNIGETWDKHAPEIILDGIAVLADVASIGLLLIPPPVGEIASVCAVAVSIEASFFSTMVTTGNYHTGEATKRDVEVAFGNFVWGSVPYVGVLPGLNQLAYDTKFNWGPYDHGELDEQWILDKMRFIRPLQQLLPGPQ